MKGFVLAATLVTTALLAGSGLVGAAVQVDGGFGGLSKTLIRVERVIPPDVIVRQSSYTLTLEGGEGDQDFRRQILNRLQALVQQAKPGIRYVTTKGDLRTIISIDSLDVALAASERTVPVRVGDGTNKEVRKETHAFVTVTSSFHATFRIEDWSNGSCVQQVAGVVSRDLNSDYDQTVGVHAPTAIAIRQSYADALMLEFGSHVVSTRTAIDIPLGDVDGQLLERGNKLAMAGQWQAAHDEWSSMPAFASPKAESYRLYNRACTLEALGYQVFQATGDVDKALARFAEADKLYQQAVDLKPGEKYFRAGWRDAASGGPLNRTHTARTAYETYRDRVASSDRST